MTPEQRYLFDIQGFLHLEKALPGSELEAAQEALERLQRTPAESLPPGVVRNKGGYSNGFSFDPAFERLALHRSIWPLVVELTAGKPRLASGTLRVNTHEDDRFGPLHSARESWGDVETPRYFTRDGRIYCDFTVAFFYLSDVHPGDGGLVLIPGSQRKSPRGCCPRSGSWSSFSPATRSRRSSRATGHWVDGAGDLAAPGGCLVLDRHDAPTDQLWQRAVRQPREWIRERGWEGARNLR